MKYIAAAFALIVGFVALVIVLGLLFSFPVMWLWNGCLVGLIAGIGPIQSVWQAWGILILCGLLFKNWSSSKSSSSN